MTVEKEPTKKILSLAVIEIFGESHNKFVYIDDYILNIIDKINRLTHFSLATYFWMSFSYPKGLEKLDNVYTGYNGRLEYYPI